MKKQIKRAISAMLAAVTVAGAIGSFGAVSAAATASSDGINYYTKVYNNPQEKLADMTLMLEKFDYQLYCNKVTGEVAWVDVKSGNTLFTNPYDVANSGGSDSTKEKLLSQIIIKYTDNDKENTMYSFVEAAQRDQIVVKNVKNGIRIEYTMGRQETRKLVPRYIEKSRYEELILANCMEDDAAVRKLNAFYTLMDPDDPSLTETAVKDLQATFPITKEMAIYVFAPDATERELNLIEQYIKTYCPNYNYETLQEDHTMTNYEGSDLDPALFKLSLEYYLDENGMTVRLPANGIRYNETTYSLTDITILPFMGAGSAENQGYNMIPDGSGTLIRFEDLKGQSPYTVSGKLYGADYAYHQMSGGQTQQVMRLPVYGITENVTETRTREVTVEPEVVTDDTAVVIDDAAAETTEAAEPTTVTETYSENYNRGFFAVIEEGDALAELYSESGGTLHKYNSIYTKFYPRPKDSYNLAQSISVAANTTWTVVSERKYTGNYRIRFYMLTDDKIAEENNIEDYYETSYVGMAKALRDHYIRNGYIAPLEKTSEDIPLYIESFGVIQTKETFLSIPIVVDTPLTTFEDLKTMYSDLSSAGITNLKFRLKGFTNGGMTSTGPYHVKFEEVVGGDEGFTDFVSFAAQNNIEVYPDFDFAYVQENSLFDGISYRTDAVKTIDNRYTQKRTYDAALQQFSRTGLIAISPSVYSRFYNNFNTEYSVFGANSISLSTLGSDLNSDFDKKEPYNREDSKKFTVRMLEKVSEDYEHVMIDSGNSYSIPYADHILNVALDSSNYTKSYVAIPLFGLAFHGYVNFAGTPTNMAGDSNYEILKIIENGAAPYFTLSYQNTEFLKEDKTLSKYYSISYDIWVEDLIAKYNLLNEALADVQYSPIEDHEFILGERVPSEKELEADRLAEEAAELAKAEAEAKAKEKAERAEKFAERKAREEAEANGEEYIPPVKDEVAEEPEEVETEETDEIDETEEAEYVYTKYTQDNGRIVKVTYANGVSFILNYNSFAVTAEGYTIEALSFVKIKN